LAQARAAGTFTAVHEAFWQAARRTDGDAAGTRALIEVLLLHRSMAAADVIAGLTAALRIGAVTADVVAVEARRHASMIETLDHDHQPKASAPVERRVVSLTQRRLMEPAAVIAGLPVDTRPPPSVHGYDDLLILPRRIAADTALESTEGTA
jgi:hypothetical protein